MKNAFDELKERGFVEQTNNDKGVRELLSKPTVVYAGVDPSASSLHIGSFTLLKALSILQKHGHKVIFLLGGATGLIGDPTDKTKARKRLSVNQVKTNTKKIKAQVEKLGLLNFDKKNPAIIVNNFDWLSKFTFIEDFMMEIAPSFSVNSMVKFKTFAKRLKEEENLSLFEFIYPLMQAWDYLYFFQKYNCRLQIGGNDQWTNILKGVNLIRKKENQEVYVIGIPLLVSDSGKKMGKTEKGAIWLDKNMTSPFQLYQEIEKTSDKLVESMFKRLTDLSLDEITKIMKSNPRDRQKKLAFEIVKTLHGQGEAQKARKDAGRIFEKGRGDTESIPVFSISKKGMVLDEILTQAEILPSKSEVRRRCEAGGVKINDKKISDSQTVINKSCLIRAGKKDFLKIKI